MKITALLLALGLAVPAAAQTDSASLANRLKTYRFGSDRTLFDDVAKAVTESRFDPSARVQLAKGFAAVLKSDAAWDAKQIACRELAFIGSEEQVGALAPLLKDDTLDHYALMALARIPGKSVDDALLKELPAAPARTRAEIMDVLAERQTVAAIPAIAAQLKSTDPLVSDRAATSLAKMRDARALSALRGAYAADRKEDVAVALLAAAGRAAPKDSAPIYDLLLRETASPAVAAAALRGIALIRGPEALPVVMRAITEDGTPRQAVAAGVLREIKGPGVTSALTVPLPRLSPRAQVLVLEALGDRGDPAASGAVTALARSADPSVRAAALRALGSVGSDSAVPLLLATAASGAKEEQESARESLVALRGAAVDTKLIAAISQGEAAQRIEAVKAVGGRRTGGGKALLDAAASTDKGVSAAALRVLRDSAGVDMLPELVGLLLGKPAGERDEAVEAVSEVARRGADENQRTGVLVARYDASTKPADRVDLLTALSQVGGNNAVVALIRATEDSNPDVRSAGLRLLAEWPTDEPMRELLRAYKSAPSPTDKAVALRGYIRMIGMNEQRSPDQALAMYREAAVGATGPAEKRLVLSGLGKLNSLGALDFARTFLADDAVRPEAELALVEIAKSTLGPHPAETRAALEPVASNSANESTRTRARDTLALLDKLKDFVITWEVSPSYQQAGADFTKLFDIPFAPENDPRSVPWRLMPVGTSAEQPWLLDLLALYPGEQKVAYLHTAVWSESGRDLILELGSDDGVKAWWNGVVVLAHNIPRAVAPGQEKVKVRAGQGWNQLLLKINQNNQGWGAVCRILNPDGTPAAGLKFAAPSEAK